MGGNEGFYLNAIVLCFWFGSVWAVLQLWLEPHSEWRFGTRGSKIGIRPSSRGLCAVSGTPAPRGFALGGPAKWRTCGGFVVCAGLLVEIPTSAQQTTHGPRSGAL
jgi:hypothetical protein